MASTQLFEFSETKHILTISMQTIDQSITSQTHGGYIHSIVIIIRLCFSQVITCYPGFQEHRFILPDFLKNYVNCIMSLFCI